MAAPRPMPEVARPLPACAGTLYLRRRFAVSADLARFSLLTLRLRYTDGVVVYLNGVELVRRRVASTIPDATTLAL